MKKKILISTGGSGGHVIPATILYEHLYEKNDIIISTDNRGIKYLDKNVYKIFLIDTPKLNLLSLPLSFFKILFLTIKSVVFLKKEKINQIDLLKIDTQGYEDKVLQGSLNVIKANKIKVIMTEISFDDIYDKYFSFSDIEKYIIPHNFRMVGIRLGSDNLFSGSGFSSDVYYFNKNYYDI